MKKNMTYKLLASSLFLTALSCGTEDTTRTRSFRSKSGTGDALPKICSKNPPATKLDQQLGLAAPNYNDNIKSIATKCVGCHSAGAQAPDLSTYAAVKGSATRAYARMVNGADPMPPSGLLPASDQQTFKAWIDGGFLESANSSSSPGPSASPSPSGSSSPTPTVSPSISPSVTPSPSSSTKPKPSATPTASPTPTPTPEECVAG